MVAAGNVGTGEYETFSQDNTTWRDFHIAVMASSSIPGIFPPTHLHDMWLMDGGTISDINIESAIL